MMNPVSDKYEIERATISAIVNLAINKGIPSLGANKCHQHQTQGKNPEAS
jgi:hypothetical protein